MKYSRANVIGWLFLGLVCILFILFHELNAAPILDLLLFILYLTVIFWRHSDFVIAFFYIIIYLLTNVFGIYMIESRVMYLPELSQNTGNLNALSLISLIHVIFIQVMLSVYQRKHMSSDEKRFSEGIGEPWDRLTLKILIFIQLAIILVSFIRIVKFPAVFMGMDRFVYGKIYLTGIWGKMTTIIAVFLPLDILYYRKFKQKLGLVTIMAYFLYLFWIGTKFGMFFIAIYWLIVPFSKGLNKKGIRKSLLVFGVVLIALLGLVGLQSKLVYQRSSAESSEYLTERIAEQGQMWWSIYGSTHGSIHPKEIHDETRTFFSSNTPSDKKYGIYKMMMLVTPQQVFYNKVYVNGARYAFSTDASVYYYFGIVGLTIWTVGMALLYSLIIRTYIFDFFHGRIISCLFLTSLFLTLNSVLLQSDFNKLFSYKTLFSLVIIWVADLYYKRRDDFGLRHS